MITRETSEGLVCVHQVDHARLAGRFADWWGGAALPHLEPRLDRHPFGKDRPRQHRIAGSNGEVLRKSARWKTQGC